MNQRGIITAAFMLASLSASFSSFAQYTLKPEKKEEDQTLLQQKFNRFVNKDRPESGYWITPLRPFKQYESQDSKIPLKTIDANKAERDFQSFVRSAQMINLRLESPNLVPADMNGFQLVNYRDGTALVESIIDKQAIVNLALEKLSEVSQFEGWQQHWNYIEQQFHQYPNLVANFSELTQNLITYATTHNLGQQLESDWDQFQQIDWSDLSLETILNEEGIQQLLNHASQTYHLATLDAQALLNGTNATLNQSLHDNLNQTLSNLNHGGFFVEGSRIFYKESQQDMLSLDVSNLANSNVTLNLDVNQNINGTLEVNIGNLFTVEGTAILNTQGLSSYIQGQGQQLLDQIVALLTSSAQGEINLQQFENLLNQLDQIYQQAQANAVDTIIQGASANTETDFKITLNLETLAMMVNGTGKYNFVPILLKMGAHDLGSITITKQQIEHISKLIAQGDETSVYEYALSNILHFEVERVGYNVLANTANNTLTTHNTGKMIPAQMAISGPGGLIRANQAYYFAARLKQWKGGSLALTGTYNENIVTNTPLIKDDGWLHARVEVDLNSVGLVYIPRIWSSDKGKVRVDGMVFVECLFIKAKYAGALTKTDTGEVFELYRVNLKEIDKASDTHALPNAAIALNAQVEVLPGVCVSGNVLCYPYLKPNGNMNEIPKSIGPYFQPSMSLIFNISQNPKKKKPPSRAAY